jgi:acyl carrier protein phosphodiesterase
MNFLAHLLLSGDKEGVIIGNFAGDFVKGLLTDEKTIGWDPNYLLGVKLHRFIDSFTDGHPIVREAKRTVALTQGKLAGIALDIYFDYFLAKSFDQFTEESLERYVRRMYAVFFRNEDLIPVQMMPMVTAMVRQDWLTSYSSVEGIGLTFRRLSKRAAFLAPIINAHLELEDNEHYYQSRFNVFFPELQSGSEKFLMMNGV